MKHIFSSISVLLFLSIFVWSCQDADAINPDDKNNVIIEFENFVGGQKLLLNTKSFKNQANEDFTITKLNYYVSNISLKKADGTEVKFPNDYFLVREEDPTSLKLTLKDVPAGDYTSISYIIGVDSARSVADISQRTGVLDLAQEDKMYWSWNSGYIFFKMEGTSAMATTPAKNFQFHVGGFGGMTGPTPNNIRKITNTLGTISAKVRVNSVPTIHIITDVLTVFSQGHTIAGRSLVHSPSLAIPIANGYMNMFTVDHVHNDLTTN
jgi:hypothetical protein